MIIISVRDVKQGTNMIVISVRDVKQGTNMIIISVRDVKQGTNMIVISVREMGASLPAVPGSVIPVNSGTPMTVTPRRLALLGQYWDRCALCPSAVSGKVSVMWDACLAVTACQLASPDPTLR